MSDGVIDQDRPTILDRWADTYATPPPVATDRHRRQPSVGTRLRRRLSLLAAVLGIALVVPSDLSGTGFGARPAALPVTAVTGPGAAQAAQLSGPGTLFRETAYALRVDQHAVVQVLSPSGSPYTTFPLSMLGGRSALPAGTSLKLQTSITGVTATLAGADGHTVEKTVLTVHPQFFTVDFSGELGSDLRSAPRFFDDGTHGLDLTGLLGSWTPDGRGSSKELPLVRTTSYAPLAPPPFDVALHLSAGWLGIGLQQVPDATTLQVGKGWVSVDYPLAILKQIADTGAGGVRDGLVQFPTFVVTMASGALAGLTAYRDALVALGAAPAIPKSRPVWWQQPIVCTWGEQNADGVIRDDPRFTADWVRQFVANWKLGSGVDAFTLVIDARWQAGIGAVEPDPKRFGSWAGMRQLIDSLHSQGISVMLWWPLWWPRQSALSDPTSSGFAAATSQAVTRLLGSGPGDLAADGLKIDWGYEIPDHVADPSRGWGAAALYRYLATIYADAHAVDPTALVESSAAAPQFASVTDAVRLSDASSEQAWNNRAMVTAAADPGMLIDGDGWQAGPEDAVQHAISSAVYGVPAFYFVTRWMGAHPIPPYLFGDFGQIAQLAEAKGQGVAVPLSSGGWEYLVKGTVTAQSFDGDSGLVVWNVGPGGQARSATVISMSGGLQRIPVPGGAGHPNVIAPGGALVPASRRGNVVTARLAAGVEYQLNLVG